MADPLDDLLEAWSIHDGSRAPNRRARIGCGRPSRARARPWRRVRAAIEGGRRLEGWKRPPAVWVAYLIAHEAHHRGQIAQALKQSGVRPPQEVSYGTWGYWGGYELKKPE